MGVTKCRKPKIHEHLIRRAHMFCNLDELETSPLCFLHYIIDQFRNTCDNNSYLVPYNHFRSMGQNVRYGWRVFYQQCWPFAKGFSSYDELWLQCFQSLKHCFGDQSTSKATVFRWFRQFMSGARTLEDDDRCGRMATTVTPENVSRVESLIKKDPKMTYA